jgi:AcrR family transcriptional regulator
MSRPAKKKSGRAKRSYHVGDLRALLLGAGEKVLRRDGVAGLGMRSVTREAGVSHTAAKPHFGDLAGFRAELAAAGFDRLADALEATASHDLLRARRVAIAKAYVHFASAHPQLFNLMFRHEMVDMTHPELVRATGRAMRALAGPLGGDDAASILSREGALRIAAGWAYVHGLAILLTEKRLRGVLKRAPSFASLAELADAVLDSVELVVDP